MTFIYGLVLIAYLSTYASSILESPSCGPPHHTHNHILGRLTKLSKTIYKEHLFLFT